MRIRIASSVAFTAAVMLLAVLVSGAPARVHAAEAVALLIGFTLPALVVGKPGDLVSRWKIVLPAVLLGALAWDIGASITIYKVDLFTMPAIYLVLPVGAAALLAAHGFAVRAVASRPPFSGSPSNQEMQRTTILPRSARSDVRR